MPRVVAAAERVFLYNPPMIRQKLLVELLSICITLLLAAAFLYPIIQHFAQPFPFLQSNFIFIVLFLTYIRFVFLLKYTWFSRLFYVKMAFILLSFPLGMWIAYSLREFLQFKDSELPDGLLALMFNNQPQADLVAFIEYVQTEYILFGVGAFLANVALFFRFLMSVWRGVNTGEV